MLLTLPSTLKKAREELSKAIAGSDKDIGWGTSMGEEDLSESMGSFAQRAIHDREHLHLSYSNLEDIDALHDGSATYCGSDATAFTQLTSYIGD